MKIHTTLFLTSSLILFTQAALAQSTSNTQPSQGPDLDLPAPSPNNPTDNTQPSQVGLGRRSTLGGYGEVHLVKEGDETEANLRRFVLFFGNSFNDWINLYSEIEVEDAHELEMEQAYLELTPHRKLGIRAGLVLVPMGQINLLHEPPTFNAVDRPLLEQRIIPSTWREIGAGIFGQVAPGLHYQLYAVNGLDASKFSYEKGIRPGRGEGIESPSKNPAISGRVNYSGILGLDLGASFYWGGAGQNTDELKGVRVGAFETDAKFSKWGTEFRAEYAKVFVSKSDVITNYLRTIDPEANPVPSSLDGWFAEAGYNVFHQSQKIKQSLVPFVRYETIRPVASLPDVENAVKPEPEKYLTLGLSYRPHPQVSFKMDYRFNLTKEEESSSEEKEGRLSFGMGYMF